MEFFFKSDIYCHYWICINLIVCKWLTDKKQNIFVLITRSKTFPLLLLVSNMESRRKKFKNYSLSIYLPIWLSPSLVIRITKYSWSLPEGSSVPLPPDLLRIFRLLTRLYNLVQNLIKSTSSILHQSQPSPHFNSSLTFSFYV